MPRATAKPKMVRAVRSFRPSVPEHVYVVLEGARFPADHPVVVAHPDFFEAVK
jgi:hypothetical protein